MAERGNMIHVNGTWQCVFLDLPSYTVYSATGSFFIPLVVMFFVYYKIYHAFAEHKARQLYRQKVHIPNFLSIKKMLFGGAVHLMPAYHRKQRNAKNFIGQRRCNINFKDKKTFFQL